MKQAPYFERPFNLLDSLKYLLNVWHPLRLRFMMLLLAIAAWTWFTPAIERAREFQLDWMLEIGLRNLVIVLVVAGGLHLLLYTFKSQAMKIITTHDHSAANPNSFILVIKPGTTCSGRYWLGTNRHALGMPVVVGLCQWTCHHDYLCREPGLVHRPDADYPDLEWFPFLLVSPCRPYRTTL